MWEYSELFAPFGWQPTVFMNSAFEIALLMVMATLLAFWAWKRQPRQLIFHIPPLYLFLFFFACTLLCKKWSGMGLLSIGLLTLYIPSRWTIAGLLAVPVLYMVLFVSGAWRGDGLSGLIAVQSARRVAVAAIPHRQRSTIGRKSDAEALVWLGRLGTESRR